MPSIVRSGSGSGIAIGIGIGSGSGGGNGNGNGSGNISSSNTASSNEVVKRVVGVRFNPIVTSSSPKKIRHGDSLRRKDTSSSGSSTAGSPSSSPPLVLSYSTSQKATKSCLKVSKASASTVQRNHHNKRKIIMDNADGGNERDCSASESDSASGPCSGSETETEEEDMTREWGIETGDENDTPLSQIDLTSFENTYTIEPGPAPESINVKEFISSVLSRQQVTLSVSVAQLCLYTTSISHLNHDLGGSHGIHKASKYIPLKKWRNECKWRCK
jgi:hypothetical protein